MPRSKNGNKVAPISFASPLEEISTPYDISKVRQYDAFLAQFQKGIPDTPEGRALIEDARNIPTNMLPCLNPLTHQGLFGGLDAFPSVKTVYEHGKRIIIVEPDGTKTNYSEKYLENPTVKLMLKLESDPISRANYGRMLLGHLALFLGGPGKFDLDNYQQEFGGITPSDPASKAQVLIDVPNGPAMAVTDKDGLVVRDKIESLEKQAAEAQKKLEEKYAEKNKLAEEKQAEAEEQQQELDNMPNPELPPAPRERNAFRRFLTSLHLWSHSARYKADLQKYNSVKAERQKYAEKKEAVDAVLTEAQSLKTAADAVQGEITDSKNKFDQEMQAFKESAEYKKSGTALESRIAVAQQYQREKEEYLNKSFDHMTSAAVLKEKLQQPSAVEKIKQAHAAQFSPGSVEVLLNIIQNREMIVQIGKESPVDLTPEQKQTIRSARKKGYQLDPNVHYDAPYENINEFVTLVDYQTASKIAHHAEAKYQNDPKTKQASFNGRANAAYNDMVAASKQAFEDIFGLKPDVETVQAVINSINLDSYVRQGITQIDKVNYDPALHKLPKVSDVNVGDMTLLLMSGIKTAYLGPQESPRPNIVEPVDVQSIAIYKPQAQAEGPAPEEPVI